MCRTQQCQTVPQPSTSSGEGSISDSCTLRLADIWMTILKCLKRNCTAVHTGSFTDRWRHFGLVIIIEMVFMWWWQGADTTVFRQSSDVQTATVTSSSWCRSARLVPVRWSWHSTLIISATRVCNHVMLLLTVVVVVYVVVYLFYAAIALTRVWSGFPCACYCIHKFACK